MIIVDTNVVSEPLRQAPDSRVVAWLDAQTVETLYLAAITVAELRFGIAVLPSGRRKNQLSDRVENELLPVFSGRILPFDLDASKTFAKLMSEARVQGASIGKADGYIAAIAASCSFSIATRDTAPFQAAGLRSSTLGRTQPRGLP